MGAAAFHPGQEVDPWPLWGQQGRIPLQPPSLPDGIAVAAQVARPLIAHHLIWTWHVDPRTPGRAPGSAGLPV